MKFSGIITVEKSDIHANGQGQRSKAKVTELKSNFVPIWAFPDCNFGYQPDELNSFSGNHQQRTPV